MKRKAFFFDTNILIDVISRRQPFYENSAALWTMSEINHINGYISAISFNNIYYVIRRQLNYAQSRRKISLLRDIFNVVSLDQKIINQAIDCNIKDFEDAIQYFSAARINAECIVTRNKKHFANPDITVLTPEEILRDYE